MKTAATKTRILFFATAALLALGIAGLVQAAANRMPTSDRVLSLAADRLSLTSAQQAELRPLIEDAMALRHEARSQRQAMAAAARVELARTDANLQALTQEQQSRTDARLAQARQLRDRFLQYYQTELTPAQQVTARELMLARMERLQQLLGLLENRRDDALLNQ